MKAKEKKEPMWKFWKKLRAACPPKSVSEKDQNEIVADEASLENLVKSVSPKRGALVCAVDTEADSLHRYRESLCLIQFAVGERCLLIDPLAITDLSALARLLSGAVVWMHGADYDMTMLRRQFGELPATVYDTQIGARLLGARKFGLADLVLHYFGIELSKSSQKADWGKRPLPEKMVEYALNDVRYLLPMGEKIVADLKAKGRFGWFEESCLAARTKVLSRDESRDEAWRIQGAGQLDRRGLAYLKAMWHWRDVEAEAWDRPSFMVATNRQLIEWGLTLRNGGKIETPSYFRAERLRRFKDALASVEAMAESEYPERPRGLRKRRDSGFDRRLDVLLKARDEKSKELDIDGSLIAPRAALEGIAGDDAKPEDVLMNWQREVLGI
jgi:ribonuclease D